MTFLKYINKNPKPKVPKAFNPRLLYPVLLAEELLAHPSRQNLLQKIEASSGLDLADYSLVYPNLIKKFAEFVQLLPMTGNSTVGSLLDDSLTRAWLALKIQQEVASNADDQDPLNLYTLFSAVLLVELGRVMTFHVTLCDVTGNVIEEWLPYERSMVSTANYYKIKPLASWQKLGRTMTPIFAKKLMPASGFLWIAQDYPLLQKWLAILMDDETGTGGFKKILALIPERFANIDPRNKLPVIKHTAIEPNEMAIAEDFLAWLSKELIDGRMLVNTPDADVHVVREDLLLLEPHLIEQFYAKYPMYRSSRIVFRRLLNMLGLHKLSGDDVEFDRYFSTYPEANENLAKVKTPNRYFLDSRNNKTGVSKIKTEAEQAILTHSAKDFTAGITKQKQIDAGNQLTVKEGFVVNLQAIYRGAIAPSISPYLKQAEKNLYVKKLRLCLKRAEQAKRSKLKKARYDF